MSTRISRLRKNYNKLSAEERFKATMSAINRDDEQERRALLESAPRITISVNDTFGLVNVFESLSLAHCIRQLNLAVYFIWLAGILEEAPMNARDANRDLFFVHYYSRLFLINETAWRQVCDDFGFNPEWNLIDNVDREIYSLLQAAARVYAGDYEISVKSLKRLYGENAEYQSSEELAKDYRSVIESQAKVWF